MSECLITVNDGKYTFVLKPGEYRVHVLRYGEPWLVIEQGCNAVWALVAEMVDASTLVAAVRRWATQGDGFQQHGELHQAFRAFCDEHGEPKPAALEGERSIEFALSSSAQFLESLIAEDVPGQRIRLQAALEGVQRALANGTTSSPGMPTEEEADAEIRAAGGNPAALVAECRSKVDVMLAKMRSASECHDPGCQREAGHAGLHMSRTWNMQLGDEVVAEWADNTDPSTVLCDRAAEEAALLQAAIALYKEARDIEKRGATTGIRDRITAADVVRALASAASLMDDEVESSKSCPGCGNEIQPDVCHCGTGLAQHSSMEEGHEFVPIGCDCGRVDDGVAS